MFSEIICEGTLMQESELSVSVLEMLLMGSEGTPPPFLPCSCLSCGFSSSIKQNQSSMAQNSYQRRLYGITWLFQILLTYKHSGNNLPAFFFFKFSEHKMNLSHGYLAFCSQKIQRGKGGFLLGSKGLRTYKKKGGSSGRGWRMSSVSLLIRK